LLLTENQISALRISSQVLFAIFTVFVSCHTTPIRRTNGRSLGTSYVGDTLSHPDESLSRSKGYCHGAQR